MANMESLIGSLSTVSHLLPFPALTEDKHKVVKEVNEKLKTGLKPPSVACYWYHRGGFWNAMSGSLYDCRGVHLCPNGMLKYWRSVQGAIRCGLKEIGVAK